MSKPNGLSNLTPFTTEYQPKNNGAPKGKRISTIIKELLNGNADKFSKDKALKGLDGNSAIAVELITMAFSKDDSSRDKLSAIKEILDRIEGKSVQHNVVETKEVLTEIKISLNGQGD